MTLQLKQLARMLRDRGGCPNDGNGRTARKAGRRFEDDDVECLK